jgi:phage-related protein
MVSNATSLVDQDVQAAEQQANATIQALINNATEAINNGTAAVNAAIDQITNQIQEIADTVDEVVANAKKELDVLEDMVEDKIENFTNVLTKYGEGALGCVNNNSDTINSVIGTSGKF